VALFRDKGSHLVHRSEVFCGHLLILHDDRETLLNEHDQFDHSSGIDDVARQRCIITQRLASAKKIAPYG
jgi:hypothetical protein